MDEHEHHGDWNISYSSSQMKEKDVHRNREHHYKRNRHKFPDQEHRSADNLEKFNHIEKSPVLIIVLMKLIGEPPMADEGMKCKKPLRPEIKNIPPRNTLAIIVPVLIAVIVSLSLLRVRYKKDAKQSK